MMWPTWPKVTLRKSENYIAPALAKSEIARRVRIGRTSVRRILGAQS
jgi:hypothetical protein